MSGARRATILIVAAVIAVAAFVVLRPDDESDDDSQRGTPTAQPAPTSTGPAEGTEPETEAKPRKPAVQLVRVRDGRPVGGVQTIEASEGETVRFRVQTETPQEIHLHGYDLYEDSTAERPAEFRFEADETGIFEVEVHGTHTQIAELKVEP